MADTRKRQRSRGSGTLYKRNNRGPWIARWFDHTGRRIERSVKTTDKAAAERILSKHISDAALRRGGVVDAVKDRLAVEGRKALAVHVADYITHCRLTQNKRYVNQKASCLAKFQTDTGATRLAELTPDTLGRYLASLKASGLAAKTINGVRETVVAFINWCVATGRMESNPMAVVPKLDATRDRRRIRRPFTDDELARLLHVASERGRKLWYMAAALAGLRRGDLQRLTWADIDFDCGTITVSDGKAKRTDLIPMHPQLADELRRLHAERLPTPMARVFPETVTVETTRKDFLQAGLARHETVTDAYGEPVMVGVGKRRRIKTRIVTTDDEGRVLDLHALRTTLGTNLARMGVAPQIAQRIMRHGDYRTTLEYYTVLGLTDTAAAMERLPDIGDDDRKAHRATGTCDIRPNDPRLKPRQLERETVRNRASRCHDVSSETGTPKRPEGRTTPVFTTQNDGAREDATACDDYQREPEQRPRQGSNL